MARSSRTTDEVTTPEEVTTDTEAVEATEVEEVEATTGDPELTDVSGPSDDPGADDDYEAEAEEASSDDDDRDPTEVAIEAWNQALEAADENGVVPADETTELVRAYQALPGRVAPAEFKAKVQGDTVAKAMADLEDPDHGLLTAMQSLFTTLNAADSTPASAPVDPTEVWVAKVTALAVLADEVRTSIPDETYGGGTVRTAVSEAMDDDLENAFTLLADQRPSATKLDEAWKASAFGGRTPDPERTKKGGGSRTTKGRDLANVPDGPVTYTYKGDTFTAEVDGDEMVTEDGERHSSPTGAAKAVNGGTSVNGWTAWSRDGRDLSQVHDDATGSDDDDDDESDDDE